MKKNIFFFLVFLFSCSSPTQKLNLPLGDYKIANSVSQHWLVNADIAQWIEYNTTENYFNQFDIIWYSDKAFDLAFVKTSRKLSNYKEVDRVECTYKFRANGKIIEKKIKQRKVKALLKPEDSNNLKTLLVNNYAKIPKDLSEIAVLQILQLKNGEYERFYENSALRHFIKFMEFKNIMERLKKMFGNILWFRAKQESYLSDKLGYSLDFDIGFVTTKTPVNLHLQWNKNFEVVNLAIQSDEKNQTAIALQLFRHFWNDLKHNNLNSIYNHSSASFRADNSSKKFKNKISLLLKSGRINNFKLSSLELDLSNIGKKWSFFYEMVKGNTWIGINLYQEINTIDYAMDKLVIVE